MAEKLSVAREELTYRQSTTAIIIDDEGEMLLVQKVNYKEDEWDTPGGGVEGAESAEQAVLRELWEEMSSDKFEIVKRSQRDNKYEWPDDVIARKLKEKGKTWRGQQRVQFLIRFVGDRNEIEFQKEEIRQIVWVRPDQVKQKLIFPGQWENVSTLLEEFGFKTK